MRTAEKMEPGFHRLVFFMLLTAASCAPDLEKVNKISADTTTVLEKGTDVKIFYSEMGSQRTVVTAREVITYSAEEPYMEFSKGLRLSFYNEQRDTTSTLTAGYGIYYNKKEEMMVRDSVKIVNNKGETLNSEELVWKRKDEKIYSDKFVRIITPDEIIYGTGFEAKQDFSDYTVKNISGIVQVSKDDK